GDVTLRALGVERAGDGAGARDQLLIGLGLVATAHGDRVRRALSLVPHHLEQVHVRTGVEMVTGEGWTSTSTSDSGAGSAGWSISHSDSTMVPVTLTSSPASTPNSAPGTP